MSAPEPNHVHELLNTAGIGSSKVSEITGGWVSWTFDADDVWIVQIPRFEDAVEATLKQVRLLPVLASAVSFRVPAPRVIGEWGGRPAVAYPKIHGRPLKPTDDVILVADQLRGLHGFPVSEAAALIDGDETGDAWRAGYISFLEQVEDEVLPLLDRVQATAIKSEYQRHLDDGLDFTPSLVHADLGTVHLLADPASGEPVGMIDFETATIGDPAVDFVGLLLALGPSVTKEIIAAYGQPTALRQLAFYTWIAPAHDVIYGRRISDQKVIDSGLDGLARRFARRAELV